MMPGTLNCDNGGATITFDTTPGSDPAGRWCIYDLTELPTGEQLIGENDRVVGLAGRIPNPVLFDETRFLLPIVFTGHVGSAGEYLGEAGAFARMWTAIAVFQAAVLSDPGTDNVRTVTFINPGQPPVAAPFQILRLIRASAAGGMWDGDLEVLQIEPWAAP